MITGGLKCPFMAQKILKQNGEIESINICISIQIMGTIETGQSSPFTFSK